ncbi:hypothetical protein SAY87_028369 [Trapa incisa]|uniref:Uncharacterized protein n=1 Tax=Trapa incisa TaxID=236973 RepID=A0AAN7L1K4_9MYRT|nr:hypothetical protein SAY87_028369 [Trapa incisa]
MGRSPPCSDENWVVKKGPWTPEEDIALVSYVQQHGPGNWRFVPAKTGLLRCSKSCRLRWTNYLRPGIKRGNFTDQEEKMIIHLQALLGNRWAAIASYLPERTDNDIKNYWNTHLRKKIRKLEAGPYGNYSGEWPERTSTSRSNMSRGQWERRLQTDIGMAKQALSDALSVDHPNPMGVPNNRNAFTDIHKPLQHQPSSAANCYASSAHNISRLLEGWMKKPLETVKVEEAGTSTNRISSNGLSYNTSVQSYNSEVSYSEGSPKNEYDLTPERRENGKSSLRMLEKWLLLDEESAVMAPLEPQGNRGSLMMDMPFGEGLSNCAYRAPTNNY